MRNPHGYTDDGGAPLGSTVTEPETEQEARQRKAEEQRIISEWIDRRLGQIGSIIFATVALAIIGGLAWALIYSYLHGGFSALGDSIHSLFNTLLEGCGNGVSTC